MLECVLHNKVDDINVKVFNIILGVKEKIFLAQHELYKCKFGLNKSVCVIKSKNGIVKYVGVSTRN